MVILRLHVSRPGGTGHVHREGCSIAYLSTCLAVCAKTTRFYSGQGDATIDTVHVRVRSLTELTVFVLGSTPGGEIVVSLGSSVVRGCWIKQIRVIFCALHWFSYSTDAGQDMFRIVFDTLPVH